MNYTFFDVETANRKNDAICSIALIETDGEKILNSFSTLINPECDFDERNIRIHGISPDMVSNNPTLKAIWPELEPYFNNHIVCGHNVIFDIRVLEKHLSYYHISIPKFQYICTMKLAKNINSIVSTKLHDLCQMFDIPLINHDALSDTKASFEIFKILRDQYHCELLPLNVESCPQNSGASSFSSRRFYSEKAVEMKEFKSFVEGLLADDNLSIEEIEHLRRYTGHLIFECEDNFYLEKIYSLIKQIYADGEITKYEIEDLRNLLSEFLDPVSANTSTSNTLSFVGKLFCLSGNFEHGSKNEIEQLILERGGLCKSNIVKATDYLVVGGLGCQDWKMGNYGSKVENALAMQDKGSNIKIISEEEFFKTIE